ncbi:MAG: hypothetical protein GX569_15400 [Candidatus Riflebacteria bacterium]|nr:hypothetical protein [Candidatus Riflebacteria bacterium]
MLDFIRQPDKPNAVDKSGAVTVSEAAKDPSVVELYFMLPLSSQKKYTLDLLCTIANDLLSCVFEISLVVDAGLKNGPGELL